MMRWGEWLVRTSTYASTLLIELSEGDSTGGDDDSVMTLMRVIQQRAGS